MLVRARPRGLGTGGVGVAEKQQATGATVATFRGGGVAKRVLFWRCPFGVQERINEGAWGIGGPRQEEAYPEIVETSGWGQGWRGSAPMLRRNAGNG